MDLFFTKPLLIRILAGLLATLAATACSGQKPNVLFIAVDDLKPAIGAYGDPIAITPHMDALAERGTIFTNNHCQQAVCGPSRASIMTGQMPNRSRVQDFGDKMRELQPGVLTLPQYFKQNGYHTLSMGKVYDGRCSDGWGTQDRPSWSEPHSWTGGRSGLGNYAGPEARDALEKLKREGAFVPGKDVQQQLVKAGFKPSVEAADVPDNHYMDAAMADAIKAKIDKHANAEKPFFIAVGFLRPHLPFNAPTSYWDLYDRASLPMPEFRERVPATPGIAYHNSGELREYSDIPNQGPISEDKQRELFHGYYASTSFVDAAIGKLLDHLDAIGIADNTLVVLWGDHGYHLGDHGLWNKHTNFEQATRSPLILAGPGVPEGKIVDTPTEFTDVFPTICDLAGLPIPLERLDGISLVPAFRGVGEAVRPAARSQFPRWENGKAHMGYSIRSDRYRLTEWFRCKYREGEFIGPQVGIELYDYTTDPGETENLAKSAEHAATVREMRVYLRDAFDLTPLEQ